MNRMRIPTRCPMILFMGLITHAELVFCDTLTLRTGQTIKGTLIEATGRQVRFAAGDSVVTYPMTDVLSISFQNSAASPGTPPQPSSGLSSLQTTPSRSGEKASLPDEQKRFCSLIDEFRDVQRRYTQETNPIRKAEMTAPDPQQYESRVKELFGEHHEFTSWRGVIRVAVWGQSIGVTFLPDCPTPNSTIQFSNAMLPPNGGLGVNLPPEDLRTVISLHSSLGNQLKEARANQPAVVNGQLMTPSGLGRLNAALAPNRATMGPPLTFKSRTGSQGASVANPNYLARFTSITLLGTENSTR